MIVGLLFMFFLTEVVGLSPALAGLVFGIGKVWDAITDPLMGYISDRTKSRFGRRRIYFLVGIVPIAISFIIMWIPIHTNSQIGLFLYYSFAYIVFATVITMVMIPYSALAAELSADYKVRNRLSGARLFFQVFRRFSQRRCQALSSTRIQQILRKDILFCLLHLAFSSRSHVYSYF
jgi:oligogalacturonide transporter